MSPSKYLVTLKPLVLCACFAFLGCSENSEPTPGAESAGGNRSEDADGRAVEGEGSEAEANGTSGTSGTSEQGDPNADIQDDYELSPVVEDETVSFTSSELLGRPTADGVTVHLMADGAVEAYLEYARAPGEYIGKSATATFAAGAPVELQLTGLVVDRQYYYRVRFRAEGAEGFAARDEYTFHTQRAPGSEFVFVTEADPHMDAGCLEEVFLLAMDNMLLDKPDFLVDLGDTALVDKYPDSYQTVHDRNLLMRNYFAHIGHSTPLFYALGNHEAEYSSKLKNSDLPMWDMVARTLFFPNPAPGDFYSGDPLEIEGVGQREAIYAWEWGDALFVVLDPYWYTNASAGMADDNWNKTLGEWQYSWLKETLEQSSAKFKFIFAHQLIGGVDDGDEEGRGGVEASTFYEWGGYNQQGQYAFDEARPGWGMPIHDLMVENHVSIFFHGHDHFYAKQDRDGVVYQLVPVATHRSSPEPTMAEGMGYVEGTIIASSGHLRVTVNDESTTVDYVRAIEPDREKDDWTNGMLSDSYTIVPR